MFQQMEFVAGNTEGRLRVQKDAGHYAYFMESKAIEYDMERYCYVTQRGGLLDNKGNNVYQNLNRKLNVCVCNLIILFANNKISYKSSLI